jgi:ATP-binding cassette subfamily C (CFTR/MRP) protein 1
LTTVAACISTIMVISGVTPVFTLCLVPIVFFYLLQQAYFTMTYSELQRLDSVGRSPIYALLGETLEGVSTIRAFSAQTTLSDRLRFMLDRQQHAFYLTIAAQCWLAIRLELTGTMIITFACLCSVLQHGSKGGDEQFAGLAGLSISFALSVTQALNWSVRMGSDVEANMVAVERIEEYCSVPSEAPHHTPADERIGNDWPAKGEIEFIGSKLRYRPGLPLVLKGLDLCIPAGSKVGIVGRTGAGKSTLMVACLRIVELDSGKILIDGVDHRDIGLAKLRSKVAVIPQDPVLFSGTVRSNLDPFEEYTDEKLCDVLARVGLYSTGKASSSSMSLTSMANEIQDLGDSILDGGSNFSVGQRQLLVIARALLCGASIVIMDEATSAVDADTDSRIQAVMRSEFQHATCLTVAHRINTIMDCDYILVMGDGRAAEFDTPKALLKRGGLFHDLVEAAAAEERAPD